MYKLKIYWKTAVNVYTKQSLSFLLRDKTAALHDFHLALIPTVSSEWRSIEKNCKEVSTEAC